MGIFCIATSFSQSTDGFGVVAVRGESPFLAFRTPLGKPAFLLLHQKKANARIMTKRMAAMAIPAVAAALGCLEPRLKDEKGPSLSEPVDRGQLDRRSQVEIRTL